MELSASSSHSSSANAATVFPYQYCSDEFDDNYYYSYAHPHSMLPQQQPKMESKFDTFTSGLSGEKRRRCYRKIAFVEAAKSKQVCPPVANITRRKKSSEKERQRNVEIKEALRKLSRSMPYVNKDLSRIRTLRLATEYMKHLNRILRGESVFCEHTGKTRPLTMSDFEKVVNQEMQTNNSYKDRAEVEMANSSRSPSSCGSVTSTMQLGRPKNIALMRSSVKDAQLSIFPPNNPQLSISDNCCRYDNNGLIKHNNEGIC